MTGLVGGFYKPLIDGGAAEAARGFRRFRASVWWSSPGRVCRVCRRLPGLALCVRVGVIGVAWFAPSLFDNRIGRKRNVDGGVLAVCLRADTCRKARREDFSDGHVSRFIALWPFGWSGCVWDSSSTSGPAGLDMNCDQSGSKFSSFLQLESLILAQNERWRQA